jgi:hypothetical protein
MRGILCFVRPGQDLSYRPDQVKHCRRFHQAGPDAYGLGLPFVDQVAEACAENDRQIRGQEVVGVFPFFAGINGIIP